MRRALALATASLALGLALSGSAQAATVPVGVGDNFFSPSTVRINPGDTVSWGWQGSDQHNVVSTSGQSERFRSPLQSSGSYNRAFPNRGRFTYFCEVHPTDMRGAVEVGPPPFPDTILPRLRGLRASPSSGAVRLTFRLSERATVTASLRGATRKRVRRRLRRGRRSITIRSLKAGRHRATLVARDGAGNRSRAAVVRFRVPR